MLARWRIAAILLALGAASTTLADVQPLFGGVLKPLKGDDQFVAPVTSPYYNENSMIGTDVRLWYVHHKVNDDALGPDVSVTDYAAQIRIALTDSLQLVAYKDGYLDFDGGPDTEGFNDLAAGIKWQFYRNDETHLYAAVGAGYEFRTGESRALQNDSEYRLWASVDKGWGKFHAGATLNWRGSTSGDDKDNGNSDVLSWHLRRLPHDRDLQPGRRDQRLPHRQRQQHRRAPQRCRRAEPGRQRRRPDHQRRPRRRVPLRRQHGDPRRVRTAAERPRQRPLRHAPHGFTRLHVLKHSFPPCSERRSHVSIRNVRPAFSLCGHNTKPAITRSRPTPPLPFRRADRPPRTRRAARAPRPGSSRREWTP
ncbi:MAG: hypothetical protein QM783_04930 [Phycisphaerales bacterium]